MSNRRPDPGRVAVPVAQRLHVRYAKHGRMRFASHRDFQRAVERAFRRAEVPVAMSAGFSPHPRISYANSAPTGSASMAEYFEVALTRECDPTIIRDEVSKALPAGFDLVEVVVAPDRELASRLEASLWQIELPSAANSNVESAVAAFLAASEVIVERLLKDGARRLDARAAVLSLEVVGQPLVAKISEPSELAARLMTEMSSSALPGCAILAAVVRHVTPAVRPDDLLSALRLEGGLDLPVPARITRVAQGPLGANQRSINDPLVVSEGLVPRVDA